MCFMFVHCLKCFKFKCKCLNLCVFKGQKSSVFVESGLDDETALEILALYVNKKSLPEQARSIVKECKGTIVQRVSIP